MHDILVIAGGNIGEMIADLLTRTGEYTVTVADRSPAALAKLEAQGVKTRGLDVTDSVAGNPVSCAPAVRAGLPSACWSALATALLP